MARDRPTGNTKKSRVWDKTNGHCHICGCELSLTDFHMDHVVPKGQGGADTEWNLLPACGHCNGMKRAATTSRTKLMMLYGRYCLREAERRDVSTTGKCIYDFVGRKARDNADRTPSVGGQARLKLWESTPKRR